MELRTRRVSVIRAAGGRGRAGGWRNTRPPPRGRGAHDVMETSLKQQQRTAEAAARRATHNMRFIDWSKIDGVAVATSTRRLAMAWTLPEQPEMRRWLCCCYCCCGRAIRGGIARSQQRKAAALQTGCRGATTQ